MSMTIRSDAFENGERIPKRFTGEGEDVSPPLGWNGVPDATKQLVLVCDDPDAPTQEPWVHWVLYGIPATTTSVPEAWTCFSRKAMARFIRHKGGVSAFPPPRQKLQERLSMRRLLRFFQYVARTDRPLRPLAPSSQGQK